MARSRVVLAAALLFALAPAMRAADEYELEAAFVYNFARFVDWPAAQNGAFQICMVAAEGAARAFEETLRGKSVHGRPVEVKRCTPAEAAASCDLAFVGPGGRKSLREIAQTSGRSVLVVGEGTDFSRAGGMIGLFVEDGKIRFDINLGATEKARLRVSSQLLRLARTVVGG